LKRKTQSPSLPLKIIHSQNMTPFKEPIKGNVFDLGALALRRAFQKCNCYFHVLIPEHTKCLLQTVLLKVVL